ncbi:Fur family transcriptional regulator [Methylophilus glucosoxydans]|uniref:Fur family transcriptional regulator n=1 Tax=Methylophilus glucosoxydans TaxID=752553 RepID=A0ABW3GJ04_9PROT
MVTAEQLMIEAGLRPTQARTAVLTTLINSHTALSQPEILNALQGVKEIDRVTVYRVLDWLQENALIHKISTEDRAWKYQLNSPKRSFKTPSSLPPGMLNNHGHAHLLCQSCGTVLCIHELAAHIPQAIFDTYQVSTIEISLKGLCPDCQKAAAVAHA